MMTNVSFTSRLTKTALVSLGIALASAASIAAPAKADTLTIDLSDVTNSNTQNYPTVKIELSQDAPGNPITATVNVVPGSTGYIGDLRGVFLNLPNASGVTISQVSGGPITAISGTSNASGSISNSAKLQGTGVSFNAGMEIGTQGIAGGDDYQTTTFTISGGGLSLSDFTSGTFGVRMMSVGDPNGSRNLSSKTIGTAPGEVVVASNPGGETGGGGEEVGGGGDEPGGGGGDTTAGGGGGTSGGGEEVGGGGGDPVAVPEPTTIAGLMMGVGGLMAARRRKANKNA